MTTAQSVASEEPKEPLIHLITIRLHEAGRRPQTHATEGVRHWRPQSDSFTRLSGESQRFTGTSADWEGLTTLRSQKRPSPETRESRERERKERVFDKYIQHSTLLCYTVDMFYVYVLADQDGELYFGSTKDLKQRISEHRSGQSRSTKGRDWKLIYYEAYCNEQDAREREQKIKYHGQAKRWLKRRLRNSLKQS